MASANVELVRSILAAWERGTPSPAEWAHPEIEYVIVGGPSPGTWTGLAGMAEGFRDWLGAWKDLRFDVDHYRELDDERVLVLIHYHGRGKASGVDLGEIGATSAQLYHVRDGKVTRWMSYWDRERALADLGLAREGGYRKEG